MIIIIQINSYLVTCKLNSPKASYKVSTSKKKEITKHLRTKYKTVYIIIIIKIKGKGKAIPVTGRGGP
jgi:hypothetical protein